MTREVLYLTGTRADFGLMLPTLKAIAATPGLSLSIVVTGMHLSPHFGLTLREVEASGLPIRAHIPVDVDDDSSIGMSRAAAQVAVGIVQYFVENKPDCCLLLGDRWEILAAATCAMLAGIPIVHICGGERSGSVDDSIRHAVSKLSHVHCVATQGARERLIKMGEEDHRIHVVGAPGLVGLSSLARHKRSKWAAEFGLDPAKPIAVVLFHPVVQDADLAGEQMKAVLSAVMGCDLQAVCLLPNADAGSAKIRSEIVAAESLYPGRMKTAAHLSREHYVSLVAGADVLVGNSSSGIVEAATFGTPVVNIGDRQANRERNTNTIDCPADESAIRDAIGVVLEWPRLPGRNIYGDGLTDQRIASILATLPESSSLLKKSMSY